MTDIPINDVTRRVQFTGNTTTGPFAFTFEILTAADIQVYKNNTLQTLTTHYTVSINANGTGSVTLTSALVSSDVLTIIGGRAIARTTDFVTAGDLLASSLNEQLDSLVIMSQQLNERIDRTIIANPGDTRISSLTLPLAANRASKLVSFDSNGDLLVDSSTNLELVLGTVTIGTILSTSDLDLKPSGGQVNILSPSGDQRIQFNNDSTPEMLFYQNSNTTQLGVINPTGSRTVNLPDASGTVALTNQATMTPDSDFTVDAPGDIILDADGGEVFLKDGGTTKFTFRVSAAGNRILSNDGLTIQADGSGDISLRPQGGQVTLLGTGGEQRINLNNDATPTIQYFQNSNNLSLAVATLSSTRTLTLPDATDTLVGKATTDTLTNKTLTSAVLNSSVSGSAIKDEDTMSSNSPNHLATQQSIKAYVDNSIAASGDITGVIAGTGMTGGGTSGTVSLNINATTGLTATSSTLSIDSTVVTKTGSHTLTNKTLTSPVLNTSVSGTDIKDEDDLVSNSASHLATQQSIKAYVDAQVAGGGAGNLSTVLGIGNTTSGNNIVFGDSSGASDDRLVFGAGSDLSIYSDGTTGQLDGNVNVTGNVGIGVTPDQTLHVHKGSAGSVDSTTNAVITLENSTHGILQFLTPNNVSNQIRFGDVNDNGRGYIDYNHNTDNLSIAVSGSEAMRIDSSGNVGIGTSSPSAGLHIDNPSNSAITAILDTDNSAVKMVFRNTTETGNNVQIGADGSNLVAFTNGTERMRINSSGNVLIGGTTEGYSHHADNLLVEDATNHAGITIRSPSTHRGSIYFSDATSGTGEYQGYIEYDHTNNNMSIVNSGNLLRIDSSGKLIFAGNVLVGTSTASSGGSVRMVLNSSGGGGLQVTRNNNGGAVVDAIQGGGARFFTFTGAVGSESYTESMRIDSSSNLLVGKSSLGVTNSGVELRNTGEVVATRNNNVFDINRTGSGNDGSIMQLRQDGGVVGNIFTSGGVQMGIGTGDTAILFASNANAWLPWNTDNTQRDNAIDLGRSATRFDDIYATNGTIQTSDRNDKQDIEELTDAEQRVAVAAKGLLRKFRWKDKVAEKGDEARTHFGIIAQDLQAAFAAEGLDAGKYAMFTSTTWTDEDTGEEKTRMGVRYSELLAFIIAAI